MFDYSKLLYSSYKGVNHIVRTDSRCKIIVHIRKLLI